MLVKLFQRQQTPSQKNMGTKAGTKNPDGALIQLKKIVKTFTTAAGDFTVLKGIDANFYKGEFVGVIGKSGSGKSTLINMITGIDRPTSGEIIIDGTAVHGLNENQLAIWRGRSLGIVFQFFQLLPTLSLLENIMLPMDFCNVYPAIDRPRHAKELLKMVDMEEHADKLPSAISGGQQQRVAIARALANDPPIIIADEPTGNLDSRTADAVFKMFEDMVQRGKTIVMVTHDPSLAQRVSRTLLVADGEVVNEWVARIMPTLTHQQMLEATHHLKPFKFFPGEAIIQENQHGDHFYIITKGQVEVALKRPGGANVVVSNMKEGEYFGEIEMFSGDKAIASVRANLTPVEVLALEREPFMALMQQSDQTRAALQHIGNKRSDENIQARGA